MTDARFVTLVSSQPPLKVTGMLGLTPPTLLSGYGGWNLITRPRRKSLTEWGGIEPRRVVVPLILGVYPGAGGAFIDGAAAQINVEPVRTTLERMAQPPAPGGEPPLITAHGVVPHASSFVNGWVIETFDWDPNPVIAPAGFATRQAVTVHLLEYVRDDRLADLTAAQTARLNAAITSGSAARAAGGQTNQPSKQKTYVVKAGDTLSRIAARVLGNYKRWTEIKTLNPAVTDPDKLTVGQRIRLP